MGQERAEDHRLPGALGRPAGEKRACGRAAATTLRRALGVIGWGRCDDPAADPPPWRLKRFGRGIGTQGRKPAFDLLPVVSLAGSRRESAQVIRAGAAPGPPAAPACRAGPPRSPAPRARPPGAGRAASTRSTAAGAARAGEIVRVLPLGQQGEAQGLARHQVRQGHVERPVGRPRPALSPSKQRIGSSARRQSRASWSSVSAVPSGATAWGKPATLREITST